MFERAFPLALALAMAVLATGGAVASPGEIDLKGARIYSNVCVHPTEGDLLGVEVIIRPAGSIPRILYRKAEGELTAPLPGVGRVNGRVVRFRVEDGGDRGVFRGELRGGRLTGVMRWGDHLDRLRLKLHSGGGYRDCR